MGKYRSETRPDFLLEPSTFYQLGAPSRQQLGYRADLFGVLSGLLPHPAELRSIGFLRFS